MVGLLPRMRKHLAQKCPSCPRPLQAAMLTTMIREEYTIARSTISAKPAVRKTRPSNDQLHFQSVTKSVARPKVPAQVQTLGRAQIRVQAPGRARILDQAQAQASVTFEAGLDGGTDLDGFVARALFEAGLPMATVEHTSFVKLCKRLKPTYTLPTALALSTPLLDREYTKVQSNARTQAVEAVLALGLESHPQLPRKHFFVTCSQPVAPNPTCFNVYNVAKSTGIKREIGASNVLVDEIEDVLMHWGTTRLSVVVMDTTESMIQAARRLQHKYPTITFLPSCAHTMTAMMTEVLALPGITRTLTTCSDLVRDNLGCSAMARVLELNQVRDLAGALSDPCDVSSSGLLECLFTVERHRDAVDAFVAGETSMCNMDVSIKEWVASLSFWEQVSTLTEVLEPFREIMKLFESDSLLLSTFYHQFTQLWGHVRVDRYGSLATKVRCIMSEYWQKMQHPAMYTAYLLDPRFPPSSLSGEATSEALAYIKRTSKAEVYKTIVDELTRFTARVGLFADDAVWESAQQCSPLHWWKGFIGGSCPNLQAVALRTLGCPVTSGLFGKRRKTFEKILTMNAKYMTEEQAIKAAVVYVNANLVSHGEDGIPSDTRSEKVS
uniref:Uncharacterized protein n=1 Tax=Hyaloperonospora arabidopsidis (strain Emoy2) TaxID=559515 RepID=M4B1S0_HYAAE